MARAVVCRAHAGILDRPGMHTAAIYVTADINEYAPDLPLETTGPAYVAAHREFYREQAEDIVGALEHALPGGTLSALLGVLALRQANILRVCERPPQDGGARARVDGGAS